MWNLDVQKFKVTYAYFRVFAGSAGQDVDVALEAVTDAIPAQLSLGLVNVTDPNNPTLDRTEKNPIVAQSPSGNSVVVSARFSNMPDGTYQAVVTDGIDGAPGGNIIVE